MRNSIIATVTTNLIAGIDRGFVVAGEQMVVVMRDSLRHLSARLAEPRKPKAKAKPALWQATSAVSSSRYQRSSSGRPMTCGTLPCCGGIF